MAQYMLSVYPGDELDLAADERELPAAAGDRYNEAGMAAVNR